jgi:5-methylcytosine-specific restriction endonuclease McrA
MGKRTSSGTRMPPEYHKAYREEPAHKAKQVAYQKAWQGAHREEISAYRKANRAKLTAQAKAWREANRAKVQTSGKVYRETHKAEIAARGKAWRDAHKIEMATYNRAHGQAKRNRNRAKQHGCEIAPDVSAKTYVRIMAGDPACTYCPASATTVDHIWPFDLYGAETDENLVPAYGNCNSSKKAKPLARWEWERVEYGVAHSPKVAAELARLVVEA